MMGKHGRHAEYDWLDDPFNDQKGKKASMGGSSKAAVGIGCLVVVVLIVVLLVVAISGAADVAASM